MSARQLPASWIDWTAWNKVNGSCSSSRYDKKTIVEDANKNWTTANHTPGMAASSTADAPASPHINNYDTNVTPPDSGNSTKFSAEQYSRARKPSCR